MCVAFSISSNISDAYDSEITLKFGIDLVETGDYHLSAITPVKSALSDLLYPIAMML